MKVTQLVPEHREVDVADVLRPLLERASWPPFDPAVVAFVARFSERLLEHPDARRSPAMVALGWWTRRAALERLGTEFRALESPQSLLAPRGVAFHLPPANVDTMFVYSAVLSLLVGNRTVVRLSQRGSPEARLLIDVLNAALADHPTMAGGLAALTYPHDPAITGALSFVADLRVVWGGDETVRAIRQVPLPPGARELAFPDRYSYGAIRADAWLSASDPARLALASAVFNDTFWFDQAGCASPRLLVWVGSPEATTAAQAGFFAALAAEIERRQHAIGVGEVLRKLSFAAEAALLRPVLSVQRWSNELFVAWLNDLDGFDRGHCGGGFYFAARVDRLDGLTPFVRRADQTLAHFGFDPAELAAFVRGLGGRGLDRVVPFGQALAFHRYWDGMDLLQEFTRRIHVVPSENP